MVGEASKRRSKVASGGRTTPIDRAAHSSSESDENDETTPPKKEDENIRVVVRIRPFLPIESGTKPCVDVLPPPPPPSPPSSSSGRQCRSRSVKIGSSASASGKKTGGASGGGSSTASTFTYDAALGSEASQRSAYETFGVSDLIESCLNGRNATTLAYGQTGAGKTYTILGPSTSAALDGASSDDDDDDESSSSSSSVGVIPRALRDLFRRLDEKKRRFESSPSSEEEEEGSESGSEGGGGSPSSVADDKVVSSFDYEVKIQFLELYGEEIRDLLSPASSPFPSPSSSPQQQQAHSKKLSIRDTKSDSEVIGATEIVVSSARDALLCMTKGMLRRVTGATAMNAQSSRSHAIMTAIVEQRTRRRSANGRRSDPDAEGRAETKIRSKFNFVDLAGSERSKRTGAKGQRMKEGIDINKGLLVLGNVISALGDPKKKQNNSKFVPFRDSKLTRLLRGSLGGSHKTLMIACVSPSSRNLDESLNCLRYANRAKNIANRAEPARAVADPTSKLVADLRGQVQRLAKELLRVRNGGDDVLDDEEGRAIPLALLESLAYGGKSDGGGGGGGGGTENNEKAGPGRPPAKTRASDERRRRPNGKSPDDEGGRRGPIDDRTTNAAVEEPASPSPPALPSPSPSPLLSPRSVTENPQDGRTPNSKTDPPLSSLTAEELEATRKSLEETRRELASESERLREMTASYEAVRAELALTAAMTAMSERSEEVATEGEEVHRDRRRPRGPTSPEEEGGDDSDSSSSAAAAAEEELERVRLALRAQTERLDEAVAERDAHRRRIDELEDELESSTAAAIEAEKETALSVRYDVVESIVERIASFEKRASSSRGRSVDRCTETTAADSSEDDTTIHSDYDSYAMPSTPASSSSSSSSFERPPVVVEEGPRSDLANFATALRCTASFLADRGEYDRTLPILHAVLRIRREVYGWDDPSVGEALHLEGKVLVATGEHDRALLVLWDALKIRETSSDSGGVAETLGLLAELHEKKGEDMHAALFYEECWRHQTANRDDDGDDVDAFVPPDALIRLAEVKSRLGELGEALRRYEEASTILTSHLDDSDDPRIGTLHYRIAEVAFRLGDDERGERSLEEFVRIRQREGGREGTENDDPEVANALYNLGNVRRARGRDDEARSCWLEALSIFRRIGLSDDDPCVMTLRGKLATVAASSPKEDDAASFGRSSDGEEESSCGHCSVVDDEHTPPPYPAYARQ